MTTSTPTQAVTLAELIRTKREHAGLSRDSLAHTVGSTLSTITRIELNHTISRPKVLRAIAAELNISREQLDSAIEATEAYLAQRDA
jgi:ribosome-binding protein aMBF1 (putative translation factor)